MRHTCFHIAVIIIILSAGVSCSTGTKKSDTTVVFSLVGRWTGFDRTGKQGSFEFLNDNSVILIIDGNPLGGRDSNGLGRLAYTADYSKNPMPLDLIGVDQDGLERGKILMIVNFINRDKITIKTFFNDVRPDCSSREGDRVFILERQSR